MANSLKEILAKAMEPVILADLEEVKAIIETKLGHSRRGIREIAEHIYNGGGKMLRSIMCLSVANLYGRQSIEKVYCLAAATEIIHNATLLHDDVIDNGTMRRGKTTANLIWGNKRTILVGDYLFSQAFKLLVKSGSLEALSLMAEASSITAAAELRQLDIINNCDIGFDDYISLISDKTAELFAAPCQSASILAGAEGDSELWHNFGLNFGISFQITDDLLDYTADPNSSGKDSLLDIASGKATLPIILLMAEASPEEKVMIRDIIQQKQDDYSQLLALIAKYEIIDKVKDQARFYGSRALTNLQSLNGNPDPSLLKMMVSLSQALVNRQF